MSNERAGLFEETEDFDVSGFEPKKPSPKAEAAPKADAVRAVSEGAAFRSREPAPVAAKREPLRHRTGRNQQFNVKLRAETIESVYEIVKQTGWTLGETVERAFAALGRELGK